MCKPISAIILKDEILFSQITHSHTEILAEHKIEDTEANAKRLFVRAELSPENGDMFSDVANWRFKVDQDIVPEWFVKDYEETRMREAVKKYVAEHVHIDKTGLQLSSGLHWIKDCKDVVLAGTAQVEELISSTVRTMWDSSTVSTMRDSSTVSTMWDSSTVRTMRDSSTVSTMWGSSTAMIPDDYYAKKVDHTKIILCQNATIKDCRTKTLYQCGDWALVSVESGKAVRNET
jgi:hypothetical protein